MATTIQSGRSSSPLLTADVASRAEIYGGRGLVFDGVTDYLKSDIGSTTYATYTISCWINPTSLSNWIRLVQVDNTSSRYLGLHGDGRVISSYYSGSWSEAYTTTTLSTGNWYHLALVDDDTQTKIYINGVATTLANSIQVSGSNLYISSHNGSGNFFDGKISDVKFFSSALTEAQVQELYLKPEQSAPSAVQDNLVAWYPMCEGNPDSPQSIVYDHSEKGLGSELSNKDFTGWTLDGSSNWSASSATSLAHTTSASGFASGTFSTSSGKLYKVSITIDSGQTGTYKVKIGGSGWLYDPVDGNDTWSGSYTFYTTEAGSSSNGLKLYAPSDFVGTFTDISVKEVLMGNHATTNFFGAELVTYPSFDTVTEHATNNNSWIDDTLDSSQEAELTQNTSSGNARTGSNSGAVAMEATTCYLSYRKTDLTAGKTYYSEIYIKSGAGSGTGRMVIGTASRGEQVTPSEAPAVDFNTSGWSKIYATWVASQAEQFITIIFTNVANAETHYIDDFSLKEIGISSSGFATADSEPTIPQVPLMRYNEKMLFSDANYVNCGTLLGNDYSGGLTISLWFNGTTINGNNGLFSFDSGLESTAIFEEDKVTWYLNGAKWSQSSTITTGKTYHIVFSLDTSSHANSGIYINGVKDSTGTATNFPASDVLDFATSPFLIGRYYSDAHSHDGLIDDVSMFNTAFDATQVQELFNDGVALDANTHSKVDYLLGYWRNDGISSWTDRTDIQAISFDGGDDLINCGSGSSIDNIFSGGGTLTAWIKPSSDGENDLGRIFDKSDATSGDEGWHFLVRSESGGVCDLRFAHGWSTTQGRWDTDNREVNINEWNHVAITYDNSSVSNNASIFVNGISVAVDEDVTPSGTVADDSSRNLFIGNNTGGDRSFDGEISQVALYSSSLSVSDISAIYALGRRNVDLSTSYPTNLVGYWLLNPTHSTPDATGSNNILDRSTNSNHGTQSGTVNFLGTNSGTPAGTPESIVVREGLNSNKDGLGFPLKNPTGNVLRLNGVDEYVSIPPSDMSLSSQMTVEFWAKNNDNGLSSDEYVVDQFDWDNNQRSFRILFDSAEKINFDVSGTGSGTINAYITDSAVSNIDNWRHYVIIFNNDSAKIYIDTTDTAITESTDGGVNSIFNNTTDNLRIGSAWSDSTSGASLWNGLLDEVRIYNRALSATEVSKNYKHGKGKHKN